MPRNLHVLMATAGFAAGLVGQCSLPTGQSLLIPFGSTRYPTNPDGTYGSNVYADLTVDTPVTITQLGVVLQDDINALPNLRDLRGQVAAVDIWAVLPSPSTALGHHAPGTGSTVPATPPGWTRLGTCAVTIADSWQLSWGTVSPAITLQPGTYGLAFNYLQVIAGPDVGASIHGVYLDTAGLPASWGDQFVSLQPRGAQSGAWSGQLFAARGPAVELDYSIAPTAGYRQQYGPGCNPRRAFYESFVPPGQGNVGGIDLAAGGNNGLSFTYWDDAAGGQFLVQNVSPYGWLQPGSTSGAIHVNATPPARSGTPAVPWDDGISAPIALPFAVPYPGGTATSFEVSSNGIVYLEANGDAGGFAGRHAPFLAGPASIAPAWGDYAPFDVGANQGQGELWVDFDPFGSWVVVTWDQVRERQGPLNPNPVTSSFQLWLSPFGGDLVYATMQLSGQPILVGFSPGHGAPDPGSGPDPRTAPDLSVAGTTGFSSQAGNFPSSLDGDRPVVGRPVTVTTIRGDDSIIGNLTLLSTAATAGLGLGGYGMPGCLSWIDTGQLIGTRFQAGTGPYAWLLAPAMPAAALGLDLHAQSLQFSAASPPLNPSNLVVGNALCLHVGSN